MKKISCIVVLALLMGVGQLYAHKGEDKITARRFAFIVGANNGGEGRVKLRYAIDDARSIANVLKNMGGVLSEDIRFLKDPDKKTLFSEMKKMKTGVNRAGSKYRRVEVIFYYSGHSDDKYLLLGNEKVSYVEFRDTINSMNADVRIAILDSCASGAFNLLKGVKKRSPFLVDTAYDMKGYAFMTSSSSHEASQESGQLKGSFFTHYLTSGLRGAADMNRDGRITLNEAYQFAFDETLSQTEKTMSGPQHPNYNIQMSGTGDVVMTEIWKSSVVLVIGKKLSGKFFIHNNESFLVVELTKPYDRNISLGLDHGKYRVTNIVEGNIYEARVKLEKGKRFLLNRKAFAMADKIPTQARGEVNKRQNLKRQTDTRKKTGRVQLEVFGGFSTLNPADLNLRVDFENDYGKFYYDDYFQYHKNTGSIDFYQKEQNGELKKIKQALPFGCRLKYTLNKSLAVSLGFTVLSEDKNSSINDRHTVVEDDGTSYIYTREVSRFRLSVRGYVPSLGLHLIKKLSTKMALEGFITAGPLIAQCSYFIDYQSAPVSDQGAILDANEWSVGELEEKGSGTGIALEIGTRIKIDLGHRFGVYLECSYAHQKVNELSGPGNKKYNFEADNWEGDWGIKEFFVERDWGSTTYRLPSNSWDRPTRNPYSRTGNAELDLSGIQAKIGMSYRF